MDNTFRDKHVAVIIPCYNESIAIAKVIEDFNKSIPEAAVYVFDNNSIDDTAKIAKNSGAIVYTVTRPGKGNVVRRMFADIEADIYVMVDGDATYDAASCPILINKLIDEHLDMVVGARQHSEKEAYRPGHTFGNKILTGCVQTIFGGDFSDMLSGYRVFSRRYVKSFPAMAKGFEIETELTVHALELRVPYAEVVTPYDSRMDGSTSKLSTYKDGMRILKTIIKLYSVERPFFFYGILALFFAISSIVFAIPLFHDYYETGLVPRFPTAILSTGLMILSAISFITGILLENVTLGHREIKMLAYLSIKRD
ncbi:glycosyltransferase family 2 protein [Acerihabitans arboris]|uniref:Glycosyltransferase n=1 Tax=Acerihabitans arboris TaxID=2691583 RepID=A0A845SGA0_9GAMM|nr:glycosyltransferase family 2 protein [Acerihabitans arboris]NDL62096.1 glycosyltransferase [Acerihabitans arboris]